MDGSLILAYHGCDISVRDRLVRGELAKLNASANKYDWLGPGTYFFENDCARARHFARSSFEDPDKHYTKQPIAQPAVVGAVLRVSRWLDMTTQEGMGNWMAAYETLVVDRRREDKPMPENERVDEQDEVVLLRQLDNAVFTLLPKVRAGSNLPEIQAVRGAFYQGKPLASSSSEFREHTHVQIALIDPRCVQAWFLPAGDRLLSDEELLEAQALLAEAKAQRTRDKPRTRA
jgi:hypothetical protein